MNLLQHPRQGFAFLIDGGDIDELARELNQGIVRHMPPPMNIQKARGAVKAFSFHWSNAQAAWDVVPWRDFPWHLDGAEFILFLGKNALSPLGKPWSLAEMRYVAKKLSPHPGYAGSFEGGSRRAMERVASRWLDAADDTIRVNPRGPDGFRVAEAAFKKLYGKEIDQAQKLLKRISTQLTKATGYPFQWKEAIWGLEAFIWSPRWDGTIFNRGVKVNIQAQSHLVTPDPYDKSYWRFQPLRVTLRIFLPKQGDVDPVAEVKLPKVPDMRAFTKLLEQVGGVDAIVDQLGGPVHGKSKATSIADVRAYLARKTYFEMEDIDEKHLHFSTRENGDVYEERPGRADIAHAQKLVQELRREFGSSIKAEVDTVDEWTSIRVTLT